MAALRCRYLTPCARLRTALHDRDASSCSSAARPRRGNPSAAPAARRSRPTPAVARWRYDKAAAVRYGRKKRARNIHHMRRTRALIKQRRAAMRAKAAHGFCGLVLEPRDIRFALDNAKTLAPASDIGRIGRAMRAPARRRMIVPGPAGRDVDLETDFAAQALTGGDSDCFWLLPLSRSPRHLRAKEHPRELVARCSSS